MSRVRVRPTPPPASHRAGPVPLLPVAGHQPQAALRHPRPRRRCSSACPTGRSAPTPWAPDGGRELKVADNGELMIRSPGLLKEYYRNPAATAEVLTNDGWYHSGDAGFIDHDGHLRIIDRAKDVGKLGGQRRMFAPTHREQAQVLPLHQGGGGAGRQARHGLRLINIDLEAVGNWASARPSATAATSTSPARTRSRPDPRVRGEGQRRPGAGGAPGRLADPPLPDPAIRNSGCRRRRAHAHLKVARLHRREVRGAGRCLSVRPQAEQFIDGGQVRGRRTGKRQRHPAHRVDVQDAFPRRAKAAA